MRVNSDPINAYLSTLTYEDYKVEKKAPYFAFILRLWMAGDGVSPQWRVSLEDTHSSERTGFGSLDEMCAYLKQLSSETKDETQWQDTPPQEI